LRDHRAVELMLKLRDAFVDLTSLHLITEQSVLQDFCL
jgi:hypothetical protein